MNEKLKSWQVNKLKGEVTVLQLNISILYQILFFRFVLGVEAF